MIISPYHGSLDDIRNKDSSTIDALDVESLDDDGKFFGRGHSVKISVLLEQL